MVKIRLARVGTTNKGKYRIVVAHEQSPRDGAFIEIIGNWDPTVKGSKPQLEKERYDHWISVGAQPSEALLKLFATSEG